MLSYPSRKYCITNCLFNLVLIPVKLRFIPVITMNCSPQLSYATRSIKKNMCLPYTYANFVKLNLTYQIEFIHNAMTIVRSKPFFVCLFQSSQLEISHLLCIS